MAIRTDNKSVVSFVRQSLKLKGKTQHNGRGGFECNVEDTIDGQQITDQQVVVDRVNKMIPKWKEQGLIKTHTVSPVGVITIEFDGSKFKQEPNETLGGYFYDTMCVAPTYNPEYQFPYWMILF